MHFWRVSEHRFWFPNMGPVFGPCTRRRKKIPACGLWLVPFWGAVFGAPFASNFSSGSRRLVPSTLLYHAVLSSWPLLKNRCVVPKSSSTLLGGVKIASTNGLEQLSSWKKKIKHTPEDPSSGTKLASPNQTQNPALQNEAVWLTQLRLSRNMNIEKMNARTPPRPPRQC